IDITSFSFPLAISSIFLISSSVSFCRCSIAPRSSSSVIFLSFMAFLIESLPSRRILRSAVRNIRRDGNDSIKKAMKDKKITEDEERGAMEHLQKLTDDEIKKMEEMAKGKEKEVMSI